MNSPAANISQSAVDIPGPDADDLTLWSVTTIIGVIDKSGPLKYWAAGLVADAALDNQATWQAMLTERGRPETWKWLRNAFTRPAKNTLPATDLGAIVHDVCETYALTGTKPDRAYVQDRITQQHPDVNIDTETNLVGVMLNQFDDWLTRFQPAYQATEVTVYNETYGYAGTLDAILTIDGTRFITDYKTSREPFDSYGKPRTPYPEQVGLQLGAYRHAEGAAVWRPRRYEKQFRRYYALSPAERDMAVPVPHVDTGLVIQITPESCAAYPIVCDRPVFDAFLYCQELFRWQQETSKTVMGEPLR